MNTHESYVSLEVAKLLKQAGFDWECPKYYFSHRIDKEVVESECLYDIQKGMLDYSGVVYAPTLDVAQRWLREVKRHDVFVSPCNGLYFYTVRKYYHEDKVDYFDYPNKDAFDTYEEALEVGIKKCLTLVL